MAKKRRQIDNSLMIVVVVAIVAVVVLMMNTGGISISTSESENIAGQRPGLAPVDRHCGLDNINCKFNSQDKFCDEN